MPNKNQNNRKTNSSNNNNGNQVSSLGRKVPYLSYNVMIIIVVTTQGIAQKAPKLRFRKTHLILITHQANGGMKSTIQLIKWLK